MSGGGIGRWKPLMARVSLGVLNIFIVLLLIASIIFVIFRADDEDWMMDNGIRHELRDVMIDELRLEESKIVQYFDHLVSTFTGDFYTSTGVRKFAEVGSFIYQDALVTICLLAVASTASILLGMAWGAYSSRNAERGSGKLLHVLAVLALSFPVSQLAIILLSTHDNVGLPPPLVDGVLNEGAVGVLKYAILPMLGLIVAGAGYFAIVTRAGLSRARRSGDEPHAFGALDYVNPFPYYLVPFLMFGIFCMERVYGYDGLGLLTYDAIRASDGPVLMACIFLISAIVFFFQLGFRAVRERTGFLCPIDGILEPSGRRSSLASHLRHTRQEKLSFTLFVRRFKRLTGAYMRHKTGVAALIILTITLLLGLFADVLSTVPNPWEAESRELNAIEDGEVVWMNPVPPSLSRSPYSGFIHPLGTDYLGRDLYSMNLYAAGNGMIVVLVTCTISIMLGLMVGLLKIVSANRTGPLSRLGKYSMTIVGQVSLAIPVTLILTSILVSPYRDHILIDPARILVQAPLVASLLILSVYCWAYRTITRPLADSLPSFAKRRGWRESREALKDSMNLFRCYLPLVLGRTLHVTKYAVVLVIILSSTLSLFGFHVFGSVLTWDYMLEEAYLYGAIFSGFWWWIAGPLAGLLLLIVSSYHCIDALERVLIEMTESDDASDRPMGQTPSVNPAAVSASSELGSDDAEAYERPSG